MSTAPGEPPPAPSGTDPLFDGLRRSGIVRTDDRWIGGVAGGVSLRAGVDPLVGRALFVLGAFLGGVGLLVYGVAWALLPEQRDGRIHLQEMVRGRFDVALVGAFLLVIAGLSSGGTWLPWWGGWGGGWWSGLLWIAVLALVVVLVVQAARNGQGRTPGAPDPQHSPYPPYGPHPDTPPADDTARPSGPAMDTPPTPAATAYAAAPASSTSTSTGPATAYGGLPPRSGGPGGPGGGTVPRPPVPPVPPGPPAPPAPPAPPKPVVRGPGAAATGVVLGLGLLALAALMVADRLAVWEGPVLLTAGAITVVLAGLAVVVAGVRGRSSGGPGSLALIGVLVLLPLAAVERSAWSWEGSTTGLGDIRETPLSVMDASAGYAVGAGQAHIDLTEVPAGRGTVQVPVSVGAGEVTITVPRDGAYTASVQVLAGQVVWLGDTVRSGVGGTVELQSPAVRDGATPRIELDVTVGAGNVHVVEATP